MTETKDIYWGTGRRKTAVARVRLMPGTGQITLNGRSANEYFGSLVLETISREPLKLTGTEDRFDVLARLNGGGMSGQAGALRHGISRALLNYDIGLRPILKRAGMLTRDPREKERKKYGQRGARARFQFSKR